MNESLQTAKKFQKISLAIFFIFLVITIVLAITFSYIFNNYWLLFGIPFALYLSKSRKLFIISTIAIIIYWFEKGFNFSNEFTFFWISAVFGSIFHLFVKTYEMTADKIIENEVEEVASEIENSIKYRNQTLNKNPKNE